MRTVRVAISAATLGLAVVLPTAVSAQVLYRTPDRILRLTAAGGRMAWAQERPGTECFRLFRRNVFGTAATPVTRCRLDPATFGGDLAWVRLVGQAVFWDEVGRGNTERDDFLHSTLPGGRGSPTVYRITCGGMSGGGKMLGPVSAGAAYLSVDSVRTDGDCDPVSGHGVVRRIAGGSRPLLDGAPAAALIAHGAHAVVEVPAAFTAAGIAPGGTLELRGDRSGRLRWSTPVTGAARAVAVSPRYAAVLVRAPSGAVWLRAYARDTGALARARPVRTSVLPMLATVGPRVVFATPRAILVWNVTRNSLHVLRRTAHAVRNLASWGRTVVWNTPHTVDGVTLPPAVP